MLLQQQSLWGCHIQVTLLSHLPMPGVPSSPVQQDRWSSLCAELILFRLWGINEHPTNPSGSGFIPQQGLCCPTAPVLAHCSLSSAVFWCCLLLLKLDKHPSFPALCSEAERESTIPNDLELVTAVLFLVPCTDRA